MKMTDLESKRIQAELARVRAARLEQEYLIAQRLEEVERLNAQIKIQVAKEQELESKLK